MKTNVYGIVSLICGIIGLMLACVGIGIFPAIVGIIMAIVGLCQKNTKYGTSIAGMVCSLVGICIFAICFMVALVSTDSDTETTKPTEITQTTTTDTEESGELIVEEENLIDCEILDCNIKYVSHEVDYDRSDKKCVFVYYTFTNNNKESKEFGYMVDDKAFQNGIELELSYWEVDGYENNKYAEIKPGAEITVACVYQLRDESTVELEIRKMFDYNNKAVDSMTIELE